MPVKTVSFTRLLATAARVGITLDAPREGEHPNLYVWTTPADDVLYIGKSASRKRVEDEEHWRNQDHTTNILAGIVSLLNENDAINRPLRYESANFNRTRLLDLLDAESWSSEPGAKHRLIDDLREMLGADYSPTVADVEAILIQSIVASGAPIGNSQHASQWSGKQLRSITSTIGAIAAMDK